jgi:hypothetical protein
MIICLREDFTLLRHFTQVLIAENHSRRSGYTGFLLTFVLEKVRIEAVKNRSSEK